MIYSGILFLGLALLVLVLGFVGSAPGAAAIVNIALTIAMASFLVATNLPYRYLPFRRRRQARRS